MDKEVRELSWSTKSFNELNTRELFDILRLRQSVFVVEQTCPYPDIDEVDLLADHFIGQRENKIVAYARLIKPGVSYVEASIGRVVVDTQARGGQLGRKLMVAALTEAERLYPNQNIKIGAQERLEKFYQSLGFETISDMYIEDDIPHIHMLYKAC